MSTPTSTAFAGFPPEGLAFLDGLGRDNTKAYFDAHRATYESALLAPAKAFVVALGEELRARVTPAIRAEPRVNGSILRINRDTRFSADKTPYKDHLDIWLWEGEGPSRERPGYFVRLRPATVTVGVGMHRFDRPVLEAYREAVGAERTGRELEVAIGARRSYRASRWAAATRTSACRPATPPTTRARTSCATTRCTCPASGRCPPRRRTDDSPPGSPSAWSGWRRWSGG